MNRREFTKLSALALAGRYLPIHAYSGANKPIGYAAVAVVDGAADNGSRGSQQKLRCQ